VPLGGKDLYRAAYRLPAVLRERAQGKRVAVVDDAISAGSAVRGTHAELLAHGAQPVVVGALVALGSEAERFFAKRAVPVTSVAQLPYELWPPDGCPLCVAGKPLESTSHPQS
jgi:predicted phosphoribosyltransferase